MSARHVLRWVGAEAFVAGGDQAGDIRPGPALLRFDGDDFMERMLAVLAERPQDLRELVARPESWDKLGEPTPLPPSLEPTGTPLSRPARALARTRALLGFSRRAQRPRSPLTTTQAMREAVQPTARPLKLFQPVHQRYYLAAAHLVCELPGLPPRVTAAGDRSGFVVRRLVGEAASECGFVKGADGHGTWISAPHPAGETVPGEELLPLFPLGYTPPGGPPRKLLAGLIPVARHDEYRFARCPGAPGQANAPAWGRADELKALARTKILAPWQGLVERAVHSLRSINADPTRAKEADPAKRLPDIADLNSGIRQLNSQLAETSWRLLQDFREFLDAHLPRVAGRLGEVPPGSPAAADHAGRLLVSLDRLSWPATLQADLTARDCLVSELHGASRPFSASLRVALDGLDPLAHAAVVRALDNAASVFPQPIDGGWPGFAFPLVVADTRSATQAEHLALPRENAAPLAFAADDSGQATATTALESWFALLEAAIDQAVAAGESGPTTPQATSAARLAEDLRDDSGPPRYIVRFVHRRCDCGPLHPPVISGPSEVFELAGFFDSEAPLRPIRIALPFDTTPGGLRKFGRNSAFIMSDILCGQMKRVRRLGFGDLVLSVLPWPFHKDLDVGAMGPCGADSGARFGTICSLSIPIITIVAFILLIVIATLLDLIFRWLPFLITCFPVPGLKGKR
ncbi:hypothetical protein [Accumulibacter sp.]|uniref:hypothetical protein n=1 Tax=Accumulibacter sp. TaxID=2053492 RepID=UPI0025F6131F|nr:hypothetical protein [Accumulibacter sp.]MCM8593858.1 hypothetical protein [Accumulibacter sp.]MCM8626100.1 hypothetical protein [Accumulibacter sp.]MDS4047999.1 hypothetical protein [Accumulibacter sp.]